MAATRQYVRGSNGRFAGARASGGTHITTGKSGGFANSAFRARVQASRRSAPARGRIKRKLQKSAAAAVGTGLGFAALGVAAHAGSKRAGVARGLKLVNANAAVVRNTRVRGTVFTSRR